MKTMLTTFVAFCLLTGMCFGQQATPCKTPQELMSALRTVLEKKDTNTFWKLHTWTNVSASMEKTWKATSLDPFVLHEKVSYSSFEIRDVPPAFNAPRKLLRGGHMQPNIPATGMFVYKIKGSNVDATVETAFGKGSDGNYWLVVDTFIPPPKNSPPTSPR